MKGGTICSSDLFRVALLPPHRPPKEEQPWDDYAIPIIVRDNKEMIEENGVCACMHV